MKTKKINKFYEVAFWTKKENLEIIASETKKFFKEVFEEKTLKEHPSFGILYWFWGEIESSNLKNLEKFLKSKNEIKQFIILKIKPKKQEKSEKQTKKVQSIDAQQLEEKLSEILNL